MRYKLSSFFLFAVLAAIAIPVAWEIYKNLPRNDFTVVQPKLSKKPLRDIRVPVGGSLLVKDAKSDAEQE